MDKMFNSLVLTLHNEYKRHFILKVHFSENVVLSFLFSMGGWEYKRKKAVFSKTIHNNTKFPFLACIYEILSTGKLGFIRYQQFFFVEMNTIKHNHLL